MRTQQPDQEDLRRSRRHKGDFLSPEVRSAVMSRIRGRDTGPEMALAQELLLLGCNWEGHARDLPGRPDFVFRDQMVAVFVDGDFWHGWRFSIWRDKLSEKWDAKIDGNRQRDRRNHQRLRRMGWMVVKIWEHQVEKDAAECAQRVLVALATSNNVLAKSPDRVRRSR